ncbi:MAG TPA: hypothetical protein VK462_01790 [Nitrososphaeraceae archaeon]|nr:hypothetical protein [Nitrososphaeraceae archaeon]
MAAEDKFTREGLIKSQADYKGNSHFDYVDITIIKDSDYYKKGDKDRVHPSLAAILKAKGLIGDYEKDVKKRDSSAPMLTDLEVVKVLDGEKEL